MQLPLIGKIGKAKHPLRWILALLAISVIGSAILFVGIWRSRSSDYDVAELTVPVETTELTVRITASGEVEPFRTVNLSPQVGGIVQEIFVEQGDRVREGQVIARMDSDDLEAQRIQSRASLAEAQAQLTDVRQGTDIAQIAQSEANLSAVEAQVVEAQSRLTLAENNFERDQNLYERGAISQLELDQSANEIRSAQASLQQVQSRVEEARQRVNDLVDDPDPQEVDQAQARVDRARGQLQAIEIQLADTLIRAPFGGIITQKFATEGAFVTPTTSASDVSSATSTAIVSLADGLEVVAEVPEADIGQISPGQTVEIQADAFPEKTFKGEVRLIAPEAIERQNVTVFQVRVRLLTGQGQLRSNMNTDVAFLGNQLSDALVVPAVAVVTQGGETGVLVPGEEKRIQFRPVTLGPQVGQQIQVLEGLEDGDRVFVDLPPGQTLDNLRFGRDDT
ncbi:MAG: efflux RND transporter periplasmic adaptor subunit [Cyanobacteria bacterium J06626_23]